MSVQLKVKFKNKSKDLTLHKCDFCGTDPEELWSCGEFEGQYCLEHFRLMHEDVSAFDSWYEKFGDVINESSKNSD